MAKLRMAKKARALKKNLPNYMIKRLSEGGFIFIFSVALFFFLSLSTYQISDPGWTHSATSHAGIHNLGGAVGAYIADALYLIFGYCAYLIPLSLVYIAYMVLKEIRIVKPLDQLVFTLRITGFVLMLTGSCGLLSLESQRDALDSIHSAGGVIGNAVAKAWYHMLNVEGATLILFAMVLVGTTWFTGLSWLKAIELLGSYTVTMFTTLINAFKKFDVFGRSAPSNLPAKTEKPKVQIIKPELTPKIQNPLLLL